MPIISGMAVLAMAGAIMATLAQPPPIPEPAAAKAMPAESVKSRPKFPDLPPTPPDWEFVQKVAFSRFPDVNAADVMRFAAEHRTAETRELKALSRIRPDEAVERLTDLIYELLGIMALRQSNPPLYAVKIRQLKSDAEVNRWTEASRQDAGEARSLSLDSLRKAIEQAFDVRQEIMAADVEALEKKLEQLKALVRRRQESRRAIVAQRFAELTADEKPLQW
ncbi:MAG: hypothetical protein QME60_01860 [Verrucomicrobiota bacterium]|nr:hypothetical protein [Verrucomicrobiota bacterium]